MISTKLANCALLCTASLLAMAPATAYAHDAAPGDAAPAAGAQSSASTPPAPEEIVVTAQFRRESAQKAAVSLQVLTAAKLADAGVTQITDISRVAPGVQISMGGNALQIYIRGAGDFSTTSYSNPAVAQSYDGVFASRSQFVANTVFDLERVEVLKGPQGTLYGRNATGGALNIIPVQPVLGENSGYVAAGVQNYSGFSGEGALNLALGQKTALRISAQGVSRDGYISDGTDDDKHVSVRVQVKSQPTDALTLRLSGNYQHLGGRGHGQVVDQATAAKLPGATPIVPGNAWTSISDSENAYIAAGTALPPGVYPINTQTIHQSVDVYGIAGHVDWDLGPATLTFIPAYQSVINGSKSIPTLNFDTTEYFSGKPSTSDTESFELRFAHNGAKAKWVVGGYYFNEDQNSYNSVRLGFVSDTDFIAKLNNKGIAAFGQLTYAVTDALRLTGGLRYTHETKSLFADRYVIPGSLGCVAGGGTGPGGSCPLPHVNGDYSTSRVNYRAGVEFDVAPQSMLFANVATGFKSGGQVNADLPAYLPETLTAYTIGSKNRFLGGKVQLNAELFWNDYNNHQENFATLDRSGAQVSALLNAGTAVSKGASIDLTLHATRNDTITFATEYVKAEYKQFHYFTYNTASPAASTGCPVTAVSGGTTTTGLWVVNCDGFQMARTPEWSGSASYAHVFDLGEDGSFTAAGDLTFASSRWLETAFVANDRADAYTQFNASLTWHDDKGRYTVQAFVRNIGNVAVYTGGQQYPFIANYVGRDIAPPRTFGARMQAKF